MYSGGGDGYYGEQGGRRGDGYGGGYGEEGGGGGGYGRHGGGGGEYGHHSGYDEQGYRRQEEYGGGRDEEGDYRRGAEHHHGRPPPQSSISESEQLMKIYCAANPDYLITVRDDDVVLVPGNEADDSQQFIKDCRWGSRVQDEKGSPAFAIVHKASGMALKHGSESFEKVGLQRYDPDTLDESVLWTQSDDVGDGYQCLRPVGDVHLNLDVKGGESIRSGAELILFKWNKQENQMWKIMPIQKHGGYAYSGGY